MAEPNQKTVSHGRRSIMPWILCIAGGILVLLTAIYLVVASSWFIKRIVMPRISRALDADVTAQKAAFSPFSQISLRGLSIKTAAGEQILEAEEAGAKYSLFSILRGTIAVGEVKLLSPRLHIRQNADGTSNLDPLLKALTEPKPQEPAPSTPAKPLRIALQNVELSNGAVSWIINDASGRTQVCQISNANFNMDKLQNGQSGRLTLAAAMEYEQTAITSVDRTANDFIKARISGSLDFKLDPSLIPQDATGAIDIDATDVQGAWREAQGLKAKLACELAPGQVRRLELRFEREGNLLGQLLISGPVDLAKSEARLKLAVESIDQDVLNLFGAVFGISFGQSTINSSNLVDISRGGNFIAANGLVSGRKLSLIRDAETTPEIDVDLEYQVTVDLTAKNALVNRFRLNGKQANAELLRAALIRPMNISWGDTLAGFRESSLEFAIANLDLADWKVFAGNLVPAGRINLTGQIVSGQDGRQLAAELSAQASGLAACVGTNIIGISEANLQAKGQLENFKKLSVDTCRINLLEAGQSITYADVTAGYDLASGEARLRTTAEASLPELLKKYPIESLSASNGIIKLNSLFFSQKTSSSASGSLLLAGFTGQYQDYTFNDYQAGLEYDAEFKEQQFRFRRLTVTPRQGFDSGGTCVLSGVYDLRNDTVELSYTFINLNQNALKPFVDPMLAPWQLGSLALEGNGKAVYNPAGQTTFSGAVKAANFAIIDPDQFIPSTPLNAQVQLNGRLRGQTVDVNEIIVDFSTSQRAGNQVKVQGRLGLSDPEAVEGQLTLNSDSLDITGLYEAFTRSGQTNLASAIQPVVQAAVENAEPEPFALPLNGFVLDAKVKRLYLGELAITNFQAVTRIDRGKVAVDNLQMTLNGGPLAGKIALDFGVPGYSYDLALNAEKIQVAPLANTFAPDFRGQFKGELDARANLSGTGVTGPNIQKNLTGEAWLSFTNASQVMMHPLANYPRARLLLTPVARFLGVPELLESPLDALSVNAQIGNGVANVRQATVLSKAFHANSQGIITLEPVLTNSTLNLPVDLALPRSLAQAIRLAPTNAEPSADYVKLPAFVKVKGTIGAPKAEIDRKAVAELLARTAMRIQGGSDDEIGLAVKNIENIIDNDKLSITNKLQEILQQINKSIKTNQPAASTNKGPRLNPLDFLNNFLNK